MHHVPLMHSVALLAALLLRTQSPTPEQAPAALELRDPFAAAAEREVAEPTPIRAQLPSELVDPFAHPPDRTRPSSVRAVPSDLVDPFARRRVRAEAVPSKLDDPFSAKPATLPAAPDLSDPFARQS
jgi:hypothetical protein